MSAKECTGPDCHRESVALGLCDSHHEQLTKRGVLSPLPHRDEYPCGGPECPRTVLAEGGLCKAHAQQFRRNGRLLPLGTRLSKGRTPRPRKQRKSQPLPAGWFKPTKATQPRGRDLPEIGPVAETAQSVRAQMLAILVASDALDLAGMLGLDDLLSDDMRRAVA